MVLHLLKTMKKKKLTRNEETVLYGLVRYPDLTDSQLSDIINIKTSTISSIKKRLINRRYYRPITIPMINHFGCELLAVLYTQFNPVIPLEERIKTTRKTIEIFPEIFFSVGEPEKGFSISLSKNYTTIGQINERRTETFGRLGLLDKKYPSEVIFPFQISTIKRFFDTSRLIKKMFNIQETEDDEKEETWFNTVDYTTLNNKEKKVLEAYVEHPSATTQEIGDMISLSRHTVSRIKKRLYNEDLLRTINIPDLHMIGADLLVFHHFKFNPHKAPSKEEILTLDSPFTLFFAFRKYEAVVISAYPSYYDHKEDEIQKIRGLKEKDLLSPSPVIEPYQYGRMTIIKDIDFTHLIKKILKNI
jgi:DNA-binding MarR family transcriptional regulator